MIFEGTVKNRISAKMLEMGKCCSDFQKGKKLELAISRLENVMSLSSKVLEQIHKGTLASTSDRK